MKTIISAAVLATSAMIAAPAAAQSSDSGGGSDRYAGADTRPQFQATHGDRTIENLFSFSRFQYTERVGIMLRRNPRLFDRAYYGAHEIVDCAERNGGLNHYLPFFESGLRGEEVSGEIYNRFRVCFGRGQRNSAGLVAPVMAEKLAIARAASLALERLAVTPEFAEVYIGTDRLDIGPVDKYSRCLVATSPAEAFAVFATDPGSREERTALSAMETATDQCVSLEPDNDMRPSLQRASLSFAALDWATLVGTPSPES